MSRATKLLSIIIPVYNEQPTIAELIDRVERVDLPIPKEIIVVDDGSTDGTTEVLRANAHKITTTHISETNAGKGAAIRIGIRYARGDIILLQDADLESDPKDYNALIGPILDGQSLVVYGSRFLRSNRIPRIRRMGNYVLTQAANQIYGIALTDMETAYKVFAREVAEQLQLTADGFEIEPEITAQVARLKYKIIEVPVAYQPRTKREGKKIKLQDGPKSLWTLWKYRSWTKGLPSVQTESKDAEHPRTILPDLDKETPQ